MVAIERPDIERPMTLSDFVYGFSPADIPRPVLDQARRCLLDLIGTGAAGIRTPLSRLIRDHAADQFAAGARGARMLFDGRKVSEAGAALAGGMTIDSFDAHDGHVLTKGHAGVAILPALLALIDAGAAQPAGDEFLAALVIGYETAIRAGIATHRIAPDYHTSGSWNALGVVAVAARLLELDPEAFRHALGIAEYHGPRSQMMRCIDHPTMIKDGSGWGAMTGVSAAYLAHSGFTGAPALVIEQPDVADLWSDLGERWRLMEMYFKPYPVCRWAQPAVRAALELRAKHNPSLAEVEALEIHTFHAATRLAHPAPADTEQAQYSLPFPAAAAFVRGHLDPGDILDESLKDEAVLGMARRIRLIDDPNLTRRFPAERYARAVLRLKDGRTFATDELPALGDAERPLSDDEITGKFLANAETAGLGSRAQRIAAEVADIERAGDTVALRDLILAPL